MNGKTKKKLEELGAHTGLIRAVEMLPKVIVGASFLANHNELRIHEVTVAIYYSRKRGKVVGAYIYGRINSDPPVNIFLEENFSLSVGARGGIKRFILRTFGGEHSFGTETRRRASMYGHYYRNTNSVNENPEVHPDAVEISVSRF